MISETSQILEKRHSLARQCSARGGTGTAVLKAMFQMLFLYSQSLMERGGDESCQGQSVATDRL